MGGMDEMSVFCEHQPSAPSPKLGLLMVTVELSADAVAADDHCLETLYPPGMCVSGRNRSHPGCDSAQTNAGVGQGTFCNQHTYDCFVAEVHESCCDEEGYNCPDGQDIPNTCPVGCAIVFPAFLETCRDHVREQAGLEEAEYEEFETLCLDQDGLALVEYALDLQSHGCVLSLGGRHRRLQAYLSQWIGASSPTCRWDQINEMVQDVDSICCAETSCDSGPPDTCTAGCAVAIHAFTQDCGETLDVIMVSRTILISQRFCWSSSSVLRGCVSAGRVPRIRAARTLRRSSRPAWNPRTRCSSSTPS